MRGRLLVTGTGRCGTHWMALALQRAGVRDVGHERAFHRRHDGRKLNRTRWRVECSWPAAAYLPIDDTYVVHLVRHPLPTIASRMARGTFSEHPPTAGQRRNRDFIFRTCPQIAEGADELEHTALHWMLWNRLIEPHAHERLMIELTTAKDVTRLARMVRRGALLRDEPEPQHTSEHPALTWADVAHIPGLVEQAREYGYA